MPWRPPPWKLWLDDQLDDESAPNRRVPEGFVGAKSTSEAKDLVAEHGLPAFLGLDHDLGGDDTSLAFLESLEIRYPWGPVPEYQVHSENPVGRQRIQSFMDSWRKSAAREVTFTLDKEQVEKAAPFINAHRLKHKGDGAIGGRFSYAFTPTGLGLIVVVHCACGAQHDVTDYDGW